MAAARSRRSRGSRRAAPTPSARRPVRRQSALDTVEAAITGSVLLFLLGGYWDVAWHIEIGRDTFWSPPHFLLYAGVLGVLASGASAFLRAWRAGRRLPGPAAAIALIGGALSLASGPIDNLWHGLYGLDVTILSPPHVLLVAGMAVAAFGALTGFALAANRRDPGRLTTILRSTGGRWRAAGYETGIVVAAGEMLTTVLAVLGEYDFDVSRYSVLWHPVLLSTLAAFVLALAVRALGRIGAATLAAAAYVSVRTVAYFALALFGMVRPNLPLIFPAAAAMDLVFLAASRGGRVGSSALPRWAAPAAGAAFAAVLLTVQWPYTAAMNDVVWSPSVLAAAALPAILGAAVSATAGWWLGGAVRPLAATTARPGAPVALRWDAWTARPGLTIAAAAIATLLLAIVPAIVRAGAPPTVPYAPRPGQEVVGYVQTNPLVPVAGQPVTLRVALNDLSLVGASPVVPYQTVRAGDVTVGILRATSERGTYEGTFTPREPGRRWFSAFFEGEEGRVAASAMFVVYRPEAAARLPANMPTPPHALVLSPEPGPDPDVPPWLKPAVYAALALILCAAAAGITYALRSGQRSARASAPPPAARRPPAVPARA